MGLASGFKLRCSRLVDAEPGLLGLVAGSGANWLEGFGGGTGFHISPLKIEINEVLET